LGRTVGRAEAGLVRINAVFSGGSEKAGNEVSWRVPRGAGGATIRGA